MANGDDWTGQTVNGWKVLDRFRNGQGRTAYRCENAETGRVRGFTAYQINKWIREGK